MAGWKIFEAPDFREVKPVAPRGAYNAAIQAEAFGIKLEPMDVLVQVENSEAFLTLAALDALNKQQDKVVG